MPTADGTERDEGSDGSKDFRFSRVGRHSIIYAIGQIATKSVGFIMLPIYARLLTPSDYGVIQLVVMTIHMATIFTAARLAVGVYHYYHKADNDQRRSEVLSTAGVLVAVTYFGVASAMILGDDFLANTLFGGGENFDLYVRIAAVGMAFEGTMVIPLAIYQLKTRSMGFVAVNLSRLATNVGLNLLFLVPFSMGVTGVLLSSAVSNIAFAIVLSVQMVRKVGVHWSMAAARDLLRFGLPLMVMNVAAFTLTFGDRYFLNRFGDTSTVGLYGLAYQFGMLVATIGYMPFGRVWDPQRFEVAKREDRDTIFARVFIYMNLVLVAMALGISLFAGDAIRIMTTPPFYPAAELVPLLAVAYIFQCWGSFLNIGIYVREKTEYFTLANWIAAGVALAGYVYLIPIWLAWGAVVSTVVSLATRAWLSHVFSQRLWRVKYNWGPVVVVFVWGTAVGVAAFLLPALPLPASIATHAALFTLFVVVAWFLPILNDEERLTVRRRLAQLVR